MKKLLILFALFQAPFETQKLPEHMQWGYAPIVDAIQLERPAPYPCNIDSGTTLMCITGPEKYWTCADKQRVLLTSEEGKHFCMKVQFD